MKKRLLFSVQYALFCAFTAFLMVTVFSKHYQFDAGFFVPLAGAFLGAFLAGWLTFPKNLKKFRHIKIGICALLFTLLFSAIGFWIDRLMQPEAVWQVSALKALADAWVSFLAGALIMIPAFVLLVYLAESATGKDKSAIEIEE